MHLLTRRDDTCVAITREEANVYIMLGFAIVAETADLMLCLYYGFYRR